MSSTKNTCILLAAGKGTRLGGPIPKQYQEINGEPLCSWSLRTFVESKEVSDIVLVIPAGDEEYVKEHVIARVPGADKKVRAMVPGGAERYLSVGNGLSAITWPCDLVLVHDGARPLIHEETIQSLCADALKYGSAIAGVKSKDTVRITDANGMGISTPDRNTVWIVQTPQVFKKELLDKAYAEMRRDPERAKEVHVTDDAMVVETFAGTPVHMSEATYDNLKVTTPDDLASAEILLRERFGEQK